MGDRETRMLQYFRSRGRNADGLEKLIRKFDLEIINVKKMEDKQTVTLDEMIKEAERELWIRYNFYAKQVKAGKMKSETARYQYKCLEAILENLKKQRDENT